MRSARLRRPTSQTTIFFVVLRRARAAPHCQLNIFQKRVDLIQPSLFINKKSARQRRIHSKRCAKLSKLDMNHIKYLLSKSFCILFIILIHSCSSQITIDTNKELQNKFESNIVVRVSLDDRLFIKKDLIKRVKELYIKEIEALKNGELKDMLNLTSNPYKNQLKNSFKKFGYKKRRKKIKKYFKCVTKMQLHIASYRNHKMNIGVLYYCKNKLLVRLSERIIINDILSISKSCVGNSIDCY